MKELANIKQDEVEIIKQVSVKKQTKIIGRYLPGDGHNLYEFNKETFEIRKVIPVVNDTTGFPVKAKPGFMLAPKDRSPRKYEVKENCAYVYALNSKNAVRKIQKKFKVPLVTEIITDEE